jgi:hypothetical protein
MQSNNRYYFFGIDVHNRFLIVLMLAGMFVFSLLFLPIWLPLGFILRLFGRRGFIYRDPKDNRWVIEINLNGFRRPVR